MDLTPFAFSIIYVVMWCYALWVDRRLMNDMMVVKFMALVLSEIIIDESISLNMTITLSVASKFSAGIAETS